MLRMPHRLCSCLFNWCFS